MRYSDTPAERAFLNARQKKELAVLVKNKYHSSNKQLARVIKIPLSEVDAMFPLCVKR